MYNTICIKHPDVEKIQRFKPNGKHKSMVCLLCENEAKYIRYRENPVKTLLSQAKTRAKKNNMPFYISEKDIIIPEFCPILNIPIFISNTGVVGSNSPSIDKHFNSCGYQVGNVSVISWRANCIKSNATMFEIEQIFKNFHKISNNNSPSFTYQNKKQMCWAAKNRSSGIFDIVPDDLNIPSFCPVLKIPLYFTPGCVKDNTPSIDRIDSSKGYEKNNIRIISFRANNLKRDSSYEEYMRIFAYYHYILPLYELEYRKSIKLLIDKNILLTMPEPIRVEEGPCILDYVNGHLEMIEKSTVHPIL